MISPCLWAQWEDNMKKYCSHLFKNCDGGIWHKSTFGWVRCKFKKFFMLSKLLKLASFITCNQGNKRMTCRKWLCGWSSWLVQQLYNTFIGRRERARVKFPHKVFFTMKSVFLVKISSVLLGQWKHPLLALHHYFSITPSAFFVNCEVLARPHLRECCLVCVFSTILTGTRLDFYLYHLNYSWQF